MNNKMMLAAIVAFLALLALFAIQLVLAATYGPFGLLVPLSTELRQWLALGVSAVGAAFAIARGLRWLLGRLDLSIEAQRGLWLVKAWAVVWLGAWLASFWFFGGPDPSLWAVGLIAKPEVLGAFAFSVAGLMLGGRADIRR